MVSLGFVVRESCYPFYEPSYTELSHGCSQEVQGKRWQKEVAVRILRTQERRRSEAVEQKARRQCTQIRRKKDIPSSKRSEIFRQSQERRTQIFFTEVQRSQEQRTETCSPSVAVSRGSRETRSNRRGATGGRPC